MVGVYNMGLPYTNFLKKLKMGEYVSFLDGSQGNFVTLRIVS